MRRYSMSVLLVAGMAAALGSMDANASGPFVDVRSVDPTITVELRYAGRNNFLGHPLYPLGTRALARPEVALALAVAQAFLQRYQCGLKIWDAYRQAAVQAKLWEAAHNSDYVANPEIGVGSLDALPSEAGADLREVPFDGLNGGVVRGRDDDFVGR